MPNEKLFEAMELSIPFKTRYLTMYEVAEQYYAVIKQAMGILEKGDCLSYEYTGDEDTLYRIQKRGKDRFALQDAKNPDTVREITANQLLNLLFAHAPFMPMVGTERGVDLR